MFNPTIAAGFPKTLLNFAVSLGADGETLLSRTGLTLADLDDPDVRIPLSAFVNLFDEAKRHCADPALALHYGEAVRTQEISVLGVLSDNAGSAEEARRSMNQYGRLAIDDDDGQENVDRIVFTEEGGKVWLKFTCPTYARFPALAESTFARIVCDARRVLGLDPRACHLRFPSEVHFMYDEPPYKAEYDRVVAAPVFFNSPVNAFVIDRALLEFRATPLNPYLSQIVASHAKRLLQRIDAGKSTRGKVEGLLLTMLHAGRAEMDTIARELGYSRQTLFRRLKEEGTTFERILSELRCVLAKEYLYGMKLSVKETAYLVGFSEPAAFSRAFKRWTGKNPGTTEDLTSDS